MRTWPRFPPRMRPKPDTAHPMLIPRATQKMHAAPACPCLEDPCPPRCGRSSEQRDGVAPGTALATTRPCGDGSLPLKVIEQAFQGHHGLGILNRVFPQHSREIFQGKLSRRNPLIEFQRLSDMLQVERQKQIYPLAGIAGRRVDAPGRHQPPARSPSPRAVLRARSTVPRPVPACPPGSREPCRPRQSGTAGSMRRGRPAPAQCPPRRGVHHLARASTPSASRA